MNSLLEPVGTPASCLVPFRSAAPSAIRSNRYAGTQLAAFGGAVLIAPGRNRRQP